MKSRIFKIILNTSFQKGFILPLTLVVVSITLAVSTGVSTILMKELYFSQLTRDSNVAYYAADEGLSCAIYLDDEYLDPATGVGIFPYNSLINKDVWIESVRTSVNSYRAGRGVVTPLTLADMKCATSVVFTNPMPNVTPFPHTKADGSAESGNTTTFSMSMDLGGGDRRCAMVTVNKTATYRQIISRGYTTCNGGSSRYVERAVINTTALN